MDDVLLRMRGIVKQFPGVRAWTASTSTSPRARCTVFSARTAPEVHPDPGSRRSHRPDEGQITWAGEEVSFSSPSAAIQRGIATIYQELDLVPGLSVADNLYLGHEKATAGFVHRGAQGRPPSRC